jgi:hypothetical protein
MGRDATKPDKVNMTSPKAQNRSKNFCHNKPFEHTPGIVSINGCATLSSNLSAHYHTVRNSLSPLACQNSITSILSMRSFYILSIVAESSPAIFVTCRRISSRTFSQHAAKGEKKSTHNSKGRFSIAAKYSSG